LLAPAGTPDTIITRLNSVIQQALKLPGVRELFGKGGVEPMGSTPDQLGEHMVKEIEKWRRVIKAAGMRRG
jgi:tripartite-type tricarboxylate transporter receptor subunit TctC